MVQAPSIKLSQDAKKAIKIQAWVVVWWEENSEEKSWTIDLLTLQKFLEGEKKEKNSRVAREERKFAIWGSLKPRCNFWHLPSQSLNSELVLCRGVCLLGKVGVCSDESESVSSVKTGLP